MKNGFSEGLAAIPSDPAAELETSGLGGGDVDRVDVIFRVPAATRRALKRLAADNDTSMQKLIEEALADLFIKYRLQPPD